MSRDIAMQSSNLENLRLRNVIVIINVIIAHRVLQLPTQEVLVS